MQYYRAAAFSVVNDQKFLDSFIGNVPEPVNSLSIQGKRYNTKEIWLTCIVCVFPLLVTP